MTDEEQKEIFAKNLINLLELNNESQKDVADALGVSPQVVNTWCKAIALPRMRKIQQLASHFGVSVTDLVDDNRGIPNLGRVAAGAPMEMVLDLSYPDEEYLKHPEEYGKMTIHGDSMAPGMQDGDTVIVHRQNDAESNDVVIVTINGDSATCKRLKKHDDCLELIPDNDIYAPFIFTPEQVENLPVKIVGKVVELRRDI